jgi:hypothetical protein
MLEGVPDYAPAIADVSPLYSAPEMLNDPLLFHQHSLLSLNHLKKKKEKNNLKKEKLTVVVKIMLRYYQSFICFIFFLLESKPLLTA